VVAACTEVGSGPDVPASLELNALPAPSVVLGDTLRDTSGRVTPVRATVRNLGGDVLDDASVRYLYADRARDTALAVDSLSGIVVALKQPTAEARLAARVGSSLQILKPVTVTARPDSMDGAATATLLVTAFPDTGRTGADRNRSEELTVRVRNVGAAGATTPVNAWIVRFQIVAPANPTNDTTRAVYLVSESGRASTIDTTSATGDAGRRVRVRAELFPSGVAGTVDTVVVQATASHRGQLLRGAPVRIALPVRKGS
jgi:hypothetical protein